MCFLRQCKRGKPLWQPVKFPQNLQGPCFIQRCPKSCFQQVSGIVSREFRGLKMILMYVISILLTFLQVFFKRVGLRCICHWSSIGCYEYNQRKYCDSARVTSFLKRAYIDSAQPKKTARSQVPHDNDYMNTVCSWFMNVEDIRVGRMAYGPVIAREGL